MLQPTDEQLALGVQRRRMDDMAMLVERHYDALVGYLYRLSNGDRPLAEDLVQETFLRVLRAIQQYRYPRPFKPWLYAIATNLARSHYSRADTRRTVLADERLRVQPSAEATPEEQAVGGEAARQAVALLMALPDHQREVIVLRYCQELKLADIAAILDIPLGTVKSRLSLGLRRLRDMVEQEDD